MPPAAGRELCGNGMGGRSNGPWGQARRREGRETTCGRVGSTPHRAVSHTGAYEDRPPSPQPLRPLRPPAAHPARERAERDRVPGCGGGRGHGAGQGGGHPARETVGTGGGRGGVRPGAGRDLARVAVRCGRVAVGARRGPAGARRASGVGWRAPDGHVCFTALGASRPVARGRRPEDFPTPRHLGKVRHGAPGGVSRPGARQGVVGAVGAGDAEDDLHKLAVPGTAPARPVLSHAGPARSRFRWRGHRPLPCMPVAADRGPRPRREEVETMAWSSTPPARPLQRR